MVQFWSFYRGLAAPMLSLTILNSLSFGMFGQLKISLVEAEDELRAQGLHSMANTLGYSRYAVAGALTGAASSPISTPFGAVFFFSSSSLIFAAKSL
jgi:hypothetical protein